MTAPTEEQLGLQEYRRRKAERLETKADYQNEYLDLQWFKAQLSKRRLDVQTQSEINDVLIDKVARYETQKRKLTDELRELQSPPKDVFGETPPLDYNAIEEKQRQLLRIDNLITEARNLAKVTAKAGEAPGLSRMTQQPGPGPGITRPGEAPPMRTRTTQGEWEQEGYRIRVR
jgi:hypothetical protein